MSYAMELALLARSAAHFGKRELAAPAVGGPTCAHYVCIKSTT